MQWEHWREWVGAPNATWEVDGEKAGLVTQVGPLSFVNIDSAGHMVRNLFQMNMSMQYISMEVLKRYKESYACSDKF